MARRKAVFPGQAGNDGKGFPGGQPPVAALYRRGWPIKGGIPRAFRRRRRQPDPALSRHPFGRNWRGRGADGWQD